MSVLAYRIVLLTGIVLGLTACAIQSVPDRIPQQISGYLSIEPATSLGQSFLVEHELAGIEVFLRPGPMQPTGILLLRLWASPTETTDLAVASLPLEQVRSPGLYRFQFNPPLQGDRRTLYARLECTEPCAIEAGIVPSSSYLEGALYINDNLSEGQLAHRLISLPLSQPADLFALIGRWILLALAAVMLFAAPGIALSGGAGNDPLEKLAIGAGVGLALAPLLMLWADQVGLRLGPLYAWALSGLALLWLAWQARNWRPGRVRLPAPPVALSWLILVLVLLAGFAVRMAIIEPLRVPAWGDSVQHAVMTQLMLDNGGLFRSWEPYAPYTTLTVQYGFATAAALLSWLTGMPGPQAVIVAGQLLNTGAILTLYPLALRLSGGRLWSGPVTLLVAGLLSPMPAFYVNWGRYAQLAGQLVLPVAICLTWDLVKARSFDWRRIMLLGLVVAGMSLCYYRMAFYYAPLAGLLVLIGGGLSWRTDLRAWFTGLGALALAGALALLLFLPWIGRITGSSLASTLVAEVETGTTRELVFSDYQNWLTLPNYLPTPLLVLAALAFFWSLARRQWLVASLALWVAILAAYVAGRLVNLPGAWLMQSFAVMIVLYLPVALLVGWLAGELATRIEKRSGLAVALAALLLLLTGWGVWQQSTIIDPAAALVGDPDLAAMEWISRNTPDNAHFLVEGFRIYNGTSAVGSDAGWWIPLLAGRSNTLPPQYALVNEVPNPPDYSQRVVELIAMLERLPPDDPEVLLRLCVEGITHVYIGQGLGQVGVNAPQLFSPQELLDSPAFRLLYQHERARVFSFDRSSCGGGQ